MEFKEEIMSNFAGHKAVVFREIDHGIMDMSNNKLNVESPANPSVGLELRAEFEKVGEKDNDSSELTFKILLYGRKKAFKPGDLFFFVDQHREFFPYGRLECEGDRLYLKARGSSRKKWCERSKWRIRALNSLLAEGYEPIQLRR
jgi:hypothetical protein